MYTHTQEEIKEVLHRVVRRIEEGRYLDVSNLTFIFYLDVRNLTFIFYAISLSSFFPHSVSSRSMMKTFR